MNFRRRHACLVDPAPHSGTCSFFPVDHFATSISIRSKILGERMKCTGPFVKNATAQGDMSGRVSVLLMMIAHIAMGKVTSGKNVQYVVVLGW
jgi:hypothetical protein